MSECVNPWPVLLVGIIIGVVFTTMIMDYLYRSGTRRGRGE